jgi:hypothetical protein
MESEEEDEDDKEKKKKKEKKIKEMKKSAKIIETAKAKMALAKQSGKRRRWYLFTNVQGEWEMLDKPPGVLTNALDVSLTKKVACARFMNGN